MEAYRREYAIMYYMKMPSREKLLEVREHVAGAANR